MNRMQYNQFSISKLQRYEINFDNKVIPFMLCQTEQSRELLKTNFHSTITSSIFYKIAQGIL